MGEMSVIHCGTVELSVGANVCTQSARALQTIKIATAIDIIVL
jgi:hypothetical protein